MGSSRRRRGRHTTHHLLPTSRGGGNDPQNLRRIPDEVHRAWHYIFRNMVPEEVIQEVIDNWTPDGYFDEVTLKKGLRLLKVS